MCYSRSRWTHLSWLHWKINRVAFYHCEPGEPKPFVMMFVYQAEILGHVEELWLLVLVSCCSFFFFLKVVSSSHRCAVVLNSIVHDEFALFCLALDAPRAAYAAPRTCRKKKVGELQDGRGSEWLTWAGRFRCRCSLKMALDFPQGQYQVGDHDRFFYERTVVALVHFSTAGDKLLRNERRTLLFRVTKKHG